MSPNRIFYLVQFSQHHYLSCVSRIQDMRSTIFLKWMLCYRIQRLSSILSSSSYCISVHNKLATRGISKFTSFSDSFFFIFKKYLFGEQRLSIWEERIERRKILQVIIECTLPSWDFSNTSDKRPCEHCSRVGAYSCESDPSATLSPRVHGVRLMNIHVIPQCEKVSSSHLLESLLKVYLLFVFHSFLFREIMNLKSSRFH